MSCDHKSPAPTPARLELERDAAAVMQINPGHDLSDDSALKIIKFYFINNISSCGAIYSLVDKGDHWAAKIALGGAGAIHATPIRLEKATGQITWPGGDGWQPGPTYRSVRELVEGTLSQSR